MNIDLKYQQFIRIKITTRYLVLMVSAYFTYNSDHTIYQAIP